MARFQITEAPISGIQVIVRKAVRDERGYLEVTNGFPDFKEVLPDYTVRQVSHSHAKVAGPVRELNLELPPNGKANIVTCRGGRSFDVVLELWNDPPRTLQWCGCELSKGDEKSLLTPPGCAHKVKAVEANSERWYLHTAPLSPQSGAGLNPLSATIDIELPILVSLWSPRDQNETSEPTPSKGVTR